MSRIQRALLVASLSAVTLSTLTLPAHTSAAGGSATATPGVYVVKNGDFLAGIAAKVGIALADLLALNSLTEKSLILPGDKLVIPVGAPAPAPVAGPATPAAGAVVHKVMSGEFLMRIAMRYKVTLADLLAVNKLTVKSVIKPGDQLALPANAVALQTVPAVAAPRATAGVTYTVKSGDFLAGIAAKFGVKLPDLLAINQLKANSLILPGATLAMPAGAVEPAAEADVSTPVVQSSAGPAGVVVAYAHAQVGKPYRFFTKGPATFDCSGLVKSAYAQIGIEMVHHSASQASYGNAVDIWSGPIKAGDLIFMATHGTPEITHVGIAVDATHWIHATRPGDVVRLSPIPPKGILTAVRRLIP